MEKIFLLFLFASFCLQVAVSQESITGKYKTELDSLGAKAMADCGCFYATKGTKGMEKIRERLITTDSKDRPYSRIAKIASADLMKEDRHDLDNAGSKSVLINNLRKSLFLACFPKMSKETKDLRYTQIVNSNTYKDNPDKIMFLMLKVFSEELKAPTGFSDYQTGSILLNVYKRRLYPIADYLTDIHNLGINPIFQLTLDDVLIAGEKKEYLRDMFCGQLNDGFTNYKKDIEKHLTHFYGAAKCN